jgi:hypothetical protein
MVIHYEYFHKALSFQRNATHHRLIIAPFTMDVTKKSREAHGLRDGAGPEKAGPGARNFAYQPP